MRLNRRAFIGLLTVAPLAALGQTAPGVDEVARFSALHAAVLRGDVATLKVALEIGASPANVTSPWDGTALIAAAHLGHDGIVRELIKAGAPLDHVNTLGWTALIEAVVLGDGGKRHQETVRALVAAGADRSLAGGDGKTPLELARQRGYAEIAEIIGE